MMKKASILHSMYHGSKCFRAMHAEARYVLYPPVNKIASELDLQEYKSTLTSALEDIKKPFADLPECTKHFSDMMAYVFGGQIHYSGCAVPYVFKMLKNGSVTPKEAKAANVMGVCIDLMFTACQLTDDLMDKSTVKLGKPCWYTREGVGRNVITDNQLIKQSVYILLKKYLQDHPNYLPLLELTHLMDTYLAYGQTLDMEPASAEFSLELYTKDKHKNIMIYKSSLPVFYYPLISAVYLADKYNERIDQQLEKFSHLLGYYYGSQNDIVDVYGDPKALSSGVDVTGGKCTWLIVKALELASDEQKGILAKHYRKPNKESELKVRELFGEMGILDLFLEYERECFADLDKQIEEADDILKEPLKKMVAIF